MALRTNISETMEGICYIWTCVILLVFAISCFAIGKVNSAFVPVGITLVLFAVLFFILFLWRRKRRSPGEDGNSGLCCCSCCCSCCDGSTCLSWMLCLPTPDPEQCTAQAQTQLRSIISSSPSSYPNPATPATAAPCSTRASRWPQLRSLQKVVQNLQREYQYLERYPDVTPRLEESYMSLVRQEAALAEWMAGRDTPTHEDIKAMKSTLARIKREMRQELTLAETNNFPQLSDPLPSISERVDIGSVVGPQPPPYTVDDPESLSTSLYTELSIRELPTPQNTDSSRFDRNSCHHQVLSVHNASQPGVFGSEHNVPARSVIMRHNAPAVNTRQSHNVPEYRASSEYEAPQIRHSYQVSADDYGVRGIEFAVMPPVDESGAPPTYEEAVSSTV